MPGGTHPPLAVEAKWPSPNYDNPITRGPALVIVSVFLPSITFLLVSARVWARFFITRAPGLDDALCVLSLGFAIANSVMVVLGCKNAGIGRHNWDIPLDRIVLLAKNQYFSTWLAFLSLTMIKISVLVFYRRLSVSFTRGFVWATTFGIAWVGVALPVSLAVSFALMCQPVEAYWQSYSLTWLVEGRRFTCLRDDILLPTSGILNTIGDLYITFIPLLLIRQLQLPRKQKIGLYSLFAGGFFVCAAGAARTAVLWHFFHETYDVSWYLWSYWIFAFIEIYLAIGIASAPALKPLTQRFVLQTQIYSSGRRSKQTNSSGMNSYQLGKHNNACENKERFRGDGYSNDTPTGYVATVESFGPHGPPPDAFAGPDLPKSLHFRNNTDDTISTVGFARTRDSGESVATDPASYVHFDSEGRQSFNSSTLEGSRLSFPLPPKSELSWPLPAHGSLC